MLSAIVLVLAAQASDGAQPATPPQKAPLQRIAVYPLQAAGIDERVALVTTSSVVAELRKLEGVSVIGFDEIRAMLDHESEKQLAGCGDESCLAEIAAALGVDIIVVGDLAAVGDDHVFGLRRINQREATVAGQVNQRLKPEDGEEFLGVVGAAVEALFPELPLKPGRARGVAPQMAVRLNPPPLDPWVFFTGVGVTSVVAAAAGGVTAVWIVAEQDRADLIDAGIADGKQLNALTGRADAAYVGVVVGWSIAGACALATAGTAGFVDWNGYRDDIAIESVQ